MRFRLCKRQKKHRIVTCTRPYLDAGGIGLVKTVSMAELGGVYKPGVPGHGVIEPVKKERIRQMIPLYGVHKPGVPGHGVIEPVKKERRRQMIPLYGVHKPGVPGHGGKEPVKKERIRQMIPLYGVHKLDVPGYGVIEPDENKAVTMTNSVSVANNVFPDLASWNVRKERTR
jgi:hypothetical protein